MTIWRTVCGTASSRILRKMTDALYVYKSRILYMQSSLLKVYLIYIKSVEYTGNISVKYVIYITQIWSLPYIQRQTRTPVPSTVYWSTCFKRVSGARPRSSTAGGRSTSKNPPKPFLHNTQDGLKPGIDLTLVSRWSSEKPSSRPYFRRRFPWKASGLMELTCWSWLDKSSELNTQTLGLFPTEIRTWVDRKSVV